MKAWIRLGIAVVVLGGAIGLLYWPHKAVVAPKAPAAPLVSINAPEVERIAIQQPDQPAVVLTKSGSSWKLEQPYAYPADAASVDSLLESLGDITGAEDVGKVNDAGAFGLDQPSVVEVGLKTGKNIDFNWGSDTPVGGNTYLRIGAGGAVQIVPTSDKSDALQTAFQLQDKTIVHFPTGQVTALAITAGKKHASFTQTKGAWPKSRQSDIQSLLDSLSDGQMTAMPDPSGAKARLEGLFRPADLVTLTWKGGAAQLDIGAKKGAAEYYARNSSSPAIFTISDYLVTDVTKLLTPAAQSPAKKK